MAPFKGPWPRTVHCFWNSRGTRTPSGHITPSWTIDASHVFDKNTHFHQSLILKSQHNSVELVARPVWSTAKVSRGVSAWGARNETPPSRRHSGATWWKGYSPHVFHWLCPLQPVHAIVGDKDGNVPVRARPQVWWSLTLLYFVHFSKSWIERFR